MVAQGLTQSDCRSWTTLQKSKFNFVKYLCGRSTELTLRGVETKLEKIVILKPATVNLVWVRSISAYTSTNCESICSATLENEKSSFY